MSGVRNIQKGITSLARLRAAIRDLPLRIRESVAKDAAGYLDIEVRADFGAGRTVYDTPRPLAVGKKTIGQRLTLVKSKKTRDNLGVTQVGTIVRAALGTPYAKYLVGKYQILPQTLPASWQEYLNKLVREYREDWEQEQKAALR